MESSLTEVDVWSLSACRFGRKYYSRYEYEKVGMLAAKGMMDAMASDLDRHKGYTYGQFTVARAHTFEYHDGKSKCCVPKSSALKFVMTGTSTIVFRMTADEPFIDSGGGGDSASEPLATPPTATIQMYLEQYVEPGGNVHGSTSVVIRGLAAMGLQLSQLEKHTGRRLPTLIV